MTHKIGAPPYLVCRLSLIKISRSLEKDGPFWKVGVASNFDWLDLGELQATIKAVGKLNQPSVIDLTLVMAEGTGFNPETYTHLLPEGEKDFDDYDESELQKYPELGYTDAQVEAEVAKLTDEEKDLFKQLKSFTDTFYRQHGYIIPPGDIVKLYMTSRFPPIPTQSAEEQECLRQEILQEVRKREASEEANVMEVPPRKIRRKTVELGTKIIDITGEDDPNKPTMITILPGADPYDQLVAEEEDQEYKFGDETQSEIHPDDDEGDDLSVITIDSLKDLDSEKVKEVWKGMAEIREKERDYYNQLASMVDDMTPNDIYATVTTTPRPGTTLPQCAEDLLEEVGTEETFRRILAVGYMAWQKYEQHRTRKAEKPYKPNTIREVATKFKVSTSRIMDLRRGEAITREQIQMRKMLKAEKKEEKSEEPPVEPEPSTSAT